MNRYDLLVRFETDRDLSPYTGDVPYDQLTDAFREAVHSFDMTVSDVFVGVGFTSEGDIECECGDDRWELRDSTIQFFDEDGLHESTPTEPHLRMDEHSTVTGYAGLPHCMGCGKLHPDVPDMGFVVGSKPEEE